jgi:hypothetical protein
MPSHFIRSLLHGVVSLTPQSLNLWEITPGGWAPEFLRTFWRRKKSLFSAVMQTREGPARGLVTVPTELHRLKHSRSRLRSSGVLRGVGPSQTQRIGCSETSVKNYQPIPRLHSRRQKFSTILRRKTKGRNMHTNERNREKINTWKKIRKSLLSQQHIAATKWIILSLVNPLPMSHRLP